jgi:Rieske Fe-S protein
LKLPAEVLRGQFMSAPKIDRRGLLKVLCASTGTVCAGMAGCGGGEMPMTGVELVKLPAPASGRIVMAIKDFPQLMKVGGGLVGAADGMPEPVAIARESESQFVAMAGMCTHMKCILRYNQLNVTLDCPCHGSSFELDGTVINGPAVKALSIHGTEFDGTTLGILLRS